MRLRDRNECASRRAWRPRRSHSRPVYRFRINLCGSDAEIAKAGQALEELGGAPIDPGESKRWACESDLGLQIIEELSRRQPALLMAVEGFEDFGDEMFSAMVIDGETSLLETREVLPPGWGSFHDDDGQALDRELLLRAGSVVARRAPEPAGSTLFGGLETSLVVCEEIGRFVADIRDFHAVDEPTETTLDAIGRLARLALRVSAASRSRTHGELRYLLALRLTQAVIHAGRSEYRETPGNADWPWWLGLLVSSACELASEAHMCDVVPADPDPAQCQGLDHHDPGETMELAARSLVTTCIQALALFGPPVDPARAPGGRS